MYVFLSVNLYIIFTVSIVYISVLGYDICLQCFLTVPIGEVATQLLGMDRNNLDLLYNTTTRTSMRAVKQNPGAKWIQINILSLPNNKLKTLMLTEF